MAIRPAQAADAPAVAAIYNRAIAERVATFETREREPREIAAWLDEGLPFLVATSPAGDIVGWARVARYSAREAYAGVGEHGVYVDAEARGGGLGLTLLEAVCSAAEEAGFHKLTSRVFADNATSRAVHAAAGFREVGVQRRHSRLDGAWKDCVLVERLLGEAAR